MRVLLSDPLNAQGVEVFRRYPQLKVDIKTGLKPAELAEIIAPYHGLVVRSATHVTREVDRARRCAARDRAGRRRASTISTSKRRRGAESW